MTTSPEGIWTSVAEAIEFRCRQCHRAGRQPAGRFAVEVRAASDEEIQLAGKLHVSGAETLVMIGMVCLQCVQALFGKRRDSRLQPQLAGVREGHEPSSLVDD